MLRGAGTRWRGFRSFRPPVSDHPRKTAGCGRNGVPVYAETGCRIRPKRGAGYRRFQVPVKADLRTEFKELSKKKSETAVSKSKILLVNRLLEQCREILKDEKSIQFLDLVEEENVPQFSDVVIILGQYVAAMSQFRSTYYGWNGTEHTWIV